MSCRTHNEWARPPRPDRSKTPAGRAGDAGRSLLNDEAGATFVEYITIVVVVAVFGMSAWALWQRAVERDARTQYTTFGAPP